MRRIITGIASALFLVSLLGAGIIYNKIFHSNINLESGEHVYFFIPSGSDFEDVMELLERENLLLDPSSFKWVAEKKNYPNHVYPGRYRIAAGLSNNELVRILRSGRQEPVRMVFNNIRTPEAFASVIASQIEPDSLEILRLFRDEDLIRISGFNRETIMGVFIPNTYEIYWNTSVEKFLERMLKEYDKFWNENRKKKAIALGLDPMEVVTLASIVDEEVLMTEEEPAIAGVYINRLKKGMRLQADPTVKFAAGDMTITRVLNKHLAIDSPYNTYKRAGLPPGPIVIPSVSAIDAVLDYSHHDYLYFCAKEDFSGYHNFARTLSQHNKNARSYQNALNRRKIWN